MSSSIIYAALATVCVFTIVNAQVEEWDPTVRDKTNFCAQMAQYTPNGDIYCQQFQLCCSSQFDPNNGDKCQVKEAECEATEGGNTGRGTCKLYNCTELITTTTTTTTARPEYSSINGAVSYVSVLSSILALVYVLIC